MAMETVRGSDALRWFKGTLRLAHWKRSPQDDHVRCGEAGPNGDEESGCSPDLLRIEGLEFGRKGESMKNM